MILRALICGLLLGGSTALAETVDRPAKAPSPRLSIGGRVGYGLPFGHWTGNTPFERSALLSNVYSGIYPLQLDVAYPFNRWFAAGVYGQFATAALQYTCVGGTCTARNVRAGVMAFFRPPTYDKWSVFVVPELGYEASEFTAQSATTTRHMDISYRGLDATLTLGADYAIHDRLRLGFFFFGRVGTYLWRSVWIVREAFEVIPNPSAHGFLGFGARVEFALF